MSRHALYHVLFFLMICLSHAQAQQPFPFDETGYDNVLKKARLEQKPVFYMIYASWCPHCHKMREEVFPDTDVSALLQQHFVVGAQDAERDGGKAVAKRFHVNSYPMFVVLDPNGGLLYAFAGELKKPDFIKEINESLVPEKQLPFLKKAFDANPSDGNKCLALVLALRKANLRTAEVASKYFGTQAEGQLVSELNWKIIANGVSDIGSREFQYVLAHQKEFAAVASEKRVNRKIENIVSESLRPLSERGDTIRYGKQRALAKAIQSRKVDSLVYVFDKQIYEKAKDWAAYQRATISATDEFASDNYSALKNTAAVYLAEITDQQALRKAAEWSERSVKLQESKDGYLQIAKIYEKLNDIPRAKAAAHNAKAFCERVGFGTKEADEMLNRLESE